MTITVGYSTVEIRAYLTEYDMLPFGQKGKWVDTQPFSKKQLYQWMRALVAGDLDRGLIPRENGTMSFPSRRKKMTEALTSDRERVLMDELAAKEKALAAKEAELARRNEDIHRLEETASTLGKAIGLLHARNVSEPDATEDQQDPSSS
ncbi:hypothetical protein CIK65_12920 [Brevibacterium aurantiacum]|uniref:Uncharacterized protein n=2 Tax=Brevibacterium aurantiacum TaxID=273384 RepID=A0A2A3YSR9_BREAU|nr:hypothetical protein CIK65_12920 [Brevibacterium aurantiacum]